MQSLVHLFSFYMCLLALRLLYAIPPLSDNNPLPSRAGCLHSIPTVSPGPTCLSDPWSRQKGHEEPHVCMFKREGLLAAVIHDI